MKEFPLAQSGSYFNRVPLVTGCSVTLNTVFRSKSHQTSSKHSCLDLKVYILPYPSFRSHLTMRVLSTEGLHWPWAMFLDQIWRMQPVSAKPNFWKKNPLILFGPVLLWFNKYTVSRCWVCNYFQSSVKVKRNVLQMVFHPNVLYLSRALPISMMFRTLSIYM